MKGHPSPSLRAAGTGGHGHHRAVLERDGTRVSYWQCLHGRPPLCACPDEPDPWVRWAERHMDRTRIEAPVEAEPAEEERACPRCGESWPLHRDFWSPTVKKGRPAWFGWCRDCKNAYDRARRSPAA